MQLFHHDGSTYKSNSIRYALLCLLLYVCIVDHETWKLFQNPNGHNSYLGAFAIKGSNV